MLSYPRKRFAQVFTVLVLVSVLAVSSGAIVVYRQAAAGYRKRVEDVSVRLLRQSRAVFDSVHFGLVPTLYQLYMDPQIRPILFQTDMSRLQLLNATRRLDDIITAAPYLHSLIAYNGRVGSYYSTEFGLVDRTSFPYAELRSILDDIKRFGVYNYIPLRVPSAAVGEENVFVIVVGDLPFVHRSIAAGIIALIDEREFRRLYLDDRSADDMGGVIILDRDSTILSHPDRTRFSTSALTEPVLERVNDFDEDEGWYTVSDGGRETLVTFVTQPAMGWRFVSVAPLDELLADLRTTRDRVIILGVVIAFLLIVADYILSRILSRPLERLADDAREIQLFVRNLDNASVDAFPPGNRSEFDEIGSALRHTRSRLAELVADSYKRRRLSRTDLLRSVVEAPADETRLVKTENEDRVWLVRAEFSIALVRLDRYRMLVIEKGRMFVEHARTQARSLLRRRFGADAFLMSTDSDEIIVIVESPQSADNEPIVFDVSGVSVTFTTVVSRRVVRYAELYDEYRSLQRLSDRRFVLGHGRVLELRDTGSDEDPEEAIRFDPEPVEKLIQGVFERREAGFLEQVHRLAEEAARGGRRSFIFFVTVFVTSLRRRTADGLGPDFRFPTEFYRLAASPDYADTIQDFVWIVQKSVDEILQRLENATERRHFALFQAARRYVTERYDDPTLCDDKIAEHLGVSTPHLREVFKKLGGTSLSRFAQSYRLDVAGSLLVDSEHSAREIATMVGMSNANYFLTIFKRRYGCSPTEYRRRSARAIPHQREFDA